MHSISFLHFNIRHLIQKNKLENCQIAQLILKSLISLKISKLTCPLKRRPFQKRKYSIIFQPILGTSWHLLGFLSSCHPRSCVEALVSAFTCNTMWYLGSGMKFLSKLKSREFLRFRGVVFNMVQYIDVCIGKTDGWWVPLNCTHIVMHLKTKCDESLWWHSGSNLVLDTFLPIAEIL